MSAVGQVADTDAARPSGRRLKRARRLNAPTLYGAGSIAVVLVIWWLITSLGVVSSFTLPSPGQLWSTFSKLWVDGYGGVPFYDHVGASLRRALLGFGIGAGLAIPAGLVLGSYRRAFWAIQPVLAFLRAIPPVAYIPLFILYLGIGELTKILVIAATAFLYTIVNVIAGVELVPTEYLRAGRMLGLSRRQLFTSVILPAALPNVMVGLEVGLLLSWAVVVAAELIAANTGLGHMVADAASYYNVRVMYVSVIAIGVIGLLLYVAIRTLTRMLTPWARD